MVPSTLSLIQGFVVLCPAVESPLGEVPYMYNVLCVARAASRLHMPANYHIYGLWLAAWHSDPNNHGIGVAGVKKLGKMAI